MKKRITLEHLKEIISRQKRDGKRIVLANGCFDLIHVGHIRYLKEAKAQGNILVVALNSDSSVRKLKGEGRPILNEEERVEIISSFYFVDYVTVFEEATVENILLTLKPHVHAKGSDYTKETVPERETVLSYGGEIAITGGPKVKNTTEISRKIGLESEGDDPE
ncbi:MAG: adenylyltransferase/cytidyltransferase family protein [Candidatus Aminicenantes bacterium]